jgi:predicted phage-related endonuclease
MDEAIDTLFPFSEIYQAGHEFFLLAVKGTLPPAFDLTRLAEQARADVASP